jgi:Fuc2NAc and GlcNAc transferase
MSGMSGETRLLCAIGSFLATALLTVFVRLYLVRRGVMDIPNSRSSHTVPVPRGGGLGIVLVFLSGVGWLVGKQAIPHDLASALIGGGAAVSAVGLLDDHCAVPCWLRLVVHCTAAGWAQWRLGGIDIFGLGDFGRSWGWIGQIVSFVALVWAINPYNFMDGIDGLASMEAIWAGGLGGFLLLRNGAGCVAGCAWALAAASAGFLVWNWPPARIFMGDVGSGFMGFVLGVLAESSTKMWPVLLWPWLILFSVFIVDATVTVLRRMIVGARWREAHRSHAYQHGTRRWKSHAKVTVTIAAVNAGWLFPLAWAASIYSAAGPILAVAAMAPLVYAAFLYHAGADDSRPKELSASHSKEGFSLEVGLQNPTALS